MAPNRFDTKTERAIEARDVSERRVATRAAAGACAAIAIGMGIWLWPAGEGPAAGACTGGVRVKRRERRGAGRAAPARSSPMFSLLCGAVASAGGIESQNVVGYQEKALKADYAYNLTVATFKSTAKAASEMTLGDITASADWTTGDDEIKTLAANGAVDKAYTYVGAELAAEVGCPVGWYLTEDVTDDSKMETIGDYCKNGDPLPLGSGLLVLVGSASTTLTYAGEVLAADQTIALKADYAYNITGNVSPVDITLGDITASADWTSGSDEIKTLADNGAVDKAYTYVHEADAADWGCPAGWYLTDDVNDDSIADLTPYCQNAVTVKAGEAFVVLVGSASTTITIPSAL